MFFFLTTSSIDNPDIKDAGAQALLDALGGKVDLDLRGVKVAASLQDLITSSRKKHTSLTRAGSSPGSTSSLKERDSVAHLPPMLDKERHSTSGATDYVAAVNAEMEALKREAELERYEYERRAGELRPEIMRQLHSLRTENALLRDQLVMKRAAYEALMEDVGVIVRKHGVNVPTSDGLVAPRPSLPVVDANGLVL